MRKFISAHLIIALAATLIVLLIIPSSVYADSTKIAFTSNRD